MLFILSVWVLVFYSCEKSALDEEHTSILSTVKQWESEQLGDTTTYLFNSDNTGSSRRFGHIDPFTWEVKKGFLRTYYKSAPKYQIGEDKYNSRGVYRIISLNENKASMEQHLYGGYVSNITLRPCSAESQQ